MSGHVELNSTNAPSGPNLTDLEVTGPDPDLVEAWDALDDDKRVTVTKGDLTHLFNALAATIGAASEGQNASYWAHHQRLTEANESIAVFRGHLKAAVENYVLLANAIMARATRK